ncbi:MAG: gamma-glutamylcyclotransferase [Acidimicrobiia bacterium]|nr:MAG: gamma-glutamylcyclotransferase [Acidimicrobiia bacterium]
MLYFAYTARIAPEHMAEVAPNATFEYIAHLPEWGLFFPITGRSWNGGLPTAAPDPGSTVWGVVYRVADGDMSAIDTVEAEEGRSQTNIDAIDRSGKRHCVTTHLADLETEVSLAPSHEYLSIMVSGSKHWGLPAGWVVGLQDHLA